jgi:Uma2 family endonuclease
VKSTLTANLLTPKFVSLIKCNGMEALVLRDSITGSMTDDEFATFCVENSGLRIERNSNLEIIIMSPVSTLSGLHSSEVFGQLYQWNAKERNGVVFDSSTGFTLPDRSVFSPDASWISLDKWKQISEEDKSKFAPVCPEFIVEVRSKSDNLEDLKKKITVWIANGTHLAWLIDPIEKNSWIFRRDGSVVAIHGFDKKIIGEKPVDGFVLDLAFLQ